MESLAARDSVGTSTPGRYFPDNTPWASGDQTICETSFAALYTNLVEPGLISLETLLERMSAGPARAYGLDAPKVAVGAPANLVLLDTQASWQVTEDGFKSRSKNSWLIGEKLRGRVRATIAAGRLVHES